MVVMIATTSRGGRALFCRRATQLRIRPVSRAIAGLGHWANFQPTARSQFPAP